MQKYSIENVFVLGYNVSSIVSVFFYQIIYLIVCPFLALKEFVEVLKISYVRDLGRGKYAKNNQIVPFEQEKKIKD